MGTLAKAAGREPEGENLNCITLFLSLSDEITIETHGVYIECGCDDYSYQNSSVFHNWSANWEL